MKYRVQSTVTKAGRRLFRLSTCSMAHTTDNQGDQVGMASVGAMVSN